MEEILNEFKNFEIPEIIPEPVNQFYVGVNEEYRIWKISGTQETEDMFLFEFPVGFEFGLHNHYKIVDGELVHDPVEYPEIEPPTPVEDRVAVLEECCAELLYQNCLLQLGITEDDL